MAAYWDPHATGDPYPFMHVAPEHVGLVPLAAAAQVEPLGPVKRVVMHWTAGPYTAAFGEYHACIMGDGSYRPMRALDAKGAHLWRRNSGSIGIALCAEQDARQDAKRNPVGSAYPATAIQIETAAKACAELLARFNLGPPGTKVATQKMRQEGETLVPVDGFTYVDVLTDHAEFARLDGYASERWDVATLMPVIFHKATWYYDGLRAKRIIPEHTIGHK